MDGKSHYGEETGLNKDGSPAHWIFKTSPIRNNDGEIVAAMEISLDITQRKVPRSGAGEIGKEVLRNFQQHPQPGLRPGCRQLHEILDCNASVDAVYGYDKQK